MTDVGRRQRFASRQSEDPHFCWGSLFGRAELIRLAARQRLYKLKPSSSLELGGRATMPRSLCPQLPFTNAGSWPIAGTYNRLLSG